MGMAIDETGSQVMAGYINYLLSLLIITDTGDSPIVNSYIAGLDLTGKNIHHPPVSQQQVGG